MSPSAIAPITRSTHFADSVEATQTSPSAKSAATTAPGTGLTGTTTGNTFLNLLVKELQNQDPSAPMDSTAMVGQMISLNQLDQLISINQNLTPAKASAGVTSVSSNSGSGSGAAGAVTNAADLLAQKNALLASPDNNSSAAANAALLAASGSTSTLNLSPFSNQFGGK